MAELRLEFTTEADCGEFLMDLASLLAGAARELIVTAPDGRGRDDLDVGEICERIVRQQVVSLRFESELLALTAVREGQSHTVVTIRCPYVGGVPQSTLWLQADPAHIGALPTLALPVASDGFCSDTAHGIVALAGASDALSRATLSVANEQCPRLEWYTSVPPRGARPLVGSHSDAIWTLGDPTQGPSRVWCEVHREDAANTPPRLSAEWWARFDELSTEHGDLAALEQHLKDALGRKASWRLAANPGLSGVSVMTVPEDGVIVTLAPSEREVVVGVDTRQPPHVLQAAVLHSVAHVALGHVRPGDAWGHWDTVETATAERPHRSWDQDVQALLRARFARPTRRVGSLDECTPLEKAQLGLWRMIGEMLGESRRLHPAAERYQHAAYQRQAAQRLVSMLEDYLGAMLCDGVGLGKTYVATTLIVHYANMWRDTLASSPERQVDDPFRVTVLAPYAVVSTWRREALPGLTPFGVSLSNVRVIAHTQLSRVSKASEVLERTRGGLSDLEHLLLSDLVVVDEAHNFRSLAARRTKVLRDLLRVQPRREQRRRVVLLTATPINNSLDDLRQEVSLLFSRPLWLSDAKTDDGYRRQAIKEVQDRCSKARSSRARGDLAPLVIHGQPDARFGDAIEFRDDLDFGPTVQRIGDYLKEQDKRLKELQGRIRVSAQKGQPQQTEAPVRIGEDLLDRIVVQRSRALCKDIERQQGSKVEVLFRPDAGAPEMLRYSDEYDGIKDVLARFMPLFDAEDAARAEARGRPLSLKIYMWYDVREGIRSADELSSVVGLQRVLVLKRLESSPVAFLITLLRLVVLHAHRLHQLANLCSIVGDKGRRKTLQSELDALIARHDRSALAKIRSLSTGDVARDVHDGFVKSLSAAYTADRPAADTDDPPPQMSLFDDSPETSSKREELDRLWPLREAILQDLDTLLTVTPELADIVFGKFERTEWPRRFIAGGEAIDWPTSPAWGLRLVTDAKLRQLVGRLVAARRAGQKVIVFSQFSDTVAYIQSVLKACSSFTRNDWQLVLRGALGLPNLRSEELTGLLATTEVITGNTEGRDEVVNAFAPFYRIGPFRPAVADGQDGERRLLDDAWEASWNGAMIRPVNVLLSTDVLAEGVNLQDAALVINFDVHWNPVRMIQRAGRIDRRLNPRIEHARELPELEVLATRLGRPLPGYYWHEHPGEGPLTVNMILPDELEAELLLRERIATKTLAIDFTLGLEQGTGAEADWMATYKYQGITSLNSFQKDRAIEQIGGHHERLTKVFTLLGVRPEWAENLNGWFRCDSATDASPLVGRALVGRLGGELERFTRYLEPTQKDGVTYWFWAEKRPGESMFDGWLILDGRPENFPPDPRRDIPFHDSVSTPVRAAHLLGAAEFLATSPGIDVLPARDIGRPLMQGASALSAPKLGTEEDRRLIAIRDFYLLQLPTLEPERSTGDVDQRQSGPPSGERESGSGRC